MTENHRTYRKGVQFSSKVDPLLPFLYNGLSVDTEFQLVIRIHGKVFVLFYYFNVVIMNFALLNRLFLFPKIKN